MLPQYWIDFLNANDLRGKECRIGEDLDESGLGADLFVFTEEQATDEAVNFYPGIVVAPDGYIPVAGCASLGVVIHISSEAVMAKTGASIASITTLSAMTGTTPKPQLPSFYRTTRYF